MCNENLNPKNPVRRLRAESGRLWRTGYQSPICCVERRFQVECLTIMNQHLLSAATIRRLRIVADSATLGNINGLCKPACGRESSVFKPPGKEATLAEARPAILLSARPQLRRGGKQ